MNRFFRTISLVLFLGYALIGCSIKDEDPSNQDPVQDGQTSLTDFDIPDNFNYETTQEINLKISSENVSEPAVYSIYTIEEGNNYQLRGKAMSDPEGNLEYNTNFSKHIQSLYIKRHSQGVDHYEVVQLISMIHKVEFTQFSQKVSASNARTLQEADSDNDGIVDALDDYPNDANKGFNNYYPSPGAYSSLAFEDLYPQRGDFDFNDIIIEYNINLVTNADNNVVELDMDFVAKSVEAELPSGFAIELPFHADSISNVTGSVLTGNVAFTGSKGLESGIVASKPVVVVFDKSTDILSGDGPVKSSDHIYITVALSNPIALSALGDVPYNPFIFVNNEREREVHLSGKTPTSKFNDAYLRAGEDVGGYKTVDNYPWGVHVPIHFAPPKENVDITNAYLNFSEFATSGGTSKGNWYTMQEGNRNSNNLHE
ncbi:LruC domain-containing protein [Flammeovirga aprica]|uniref:LruC domain-containing protein n=1 Tax=Flammeovirga aprica JL-4 TaxID=694437 RepID=A0A7X9RX54_9BACT|nr:LruC domain-containing protein [Flammeovirga aprica]NME70366.1 LruC domain-containing protein [Flammeovirga aprica JL-4]